MHQLHGVGHLVHVLVLRRALRGEGEHRHARVEAQQRLAGLRGSDRDVGQLFAGRIDVHGAVAEHQHAVVAVLLILHFHQEAGRNGLDARGALDDLQRRTQHVAGGVDRARDHRVRVAHLEHHRAVEQRVLQAQLGGLLQRHALLLADMEKLLGVRSGLLARRRIGDGNAGQVNAQLGGLRLDLGLRAHQRDLGQTQLHNLLRGLHGARLSALSQHDVLHIGGSFRSDFVNDRHL